MFSTDVALEGNTVQRDGAASEQTVPILVLICGDKK